MDTEKGEINIINNEVKKAFPKTPKGKLTIETESVKNNAGEYINNLLSNKNDPKIKKRLNLISSLDNYEKVNYNSCFTEGNLNSNKIESEFAAQKKNEIRENISKKLRSGNNDNKLRRMMDQTSTLFDNKIYESTCAGKINKKKFVCFCNFYFDLY